MAEIPSLERPPTPEELLMRLDQDIRRFQIDYERFFSGNLPTPPEQRRISVQNQIKELRTVRMKAVANRFRFNTLEAKFNALLVLFNRRLRELEQGRAAARRAASEPELDARRGVVIQGQTSTAEAQALYHGLYADSSTGARADFERFQTYLDKQAQAIRKKTGCDQVRFRVTREDGKPKLKAKPVQEASSD